LSRMTAKVVGQSEKHHRATQDTIGHVTANRLKEATQETVHSIEDVVQRLKGMQEKMEQAVELNQVHMHRVSSSLLAMDAVGINHLYRSRDEASSDMFDDIKRAQQLDIRLMGISLNDFVQGRENFGLVWKTIKARVDSPVAYPLNLRILLIHPYCLGAQLRSKGEARGTDAIVSRLMTDVQEVVKELEKLMSRSLSNVNVKIECRLYQLPPTLFLCSVNDVCYMQPYFFWSKRQEIPVPVMKFVKNPDDQLQEDQLQHQLNEHFDWIWNQASISLDEFRNQNILGVDKGMRQSAAINVFLDRSESRKRIEQMLKHAKKDVWIQGISLQSFFSPGPLFTEIVNLISEGVVRVHVLLIDPESEQAKLRSFRERLFVDSSLSFETYLGSELHKESRLFADTAQSIKDITNLMDHLVKSKGLDPRWQHRLRVRKYVSAPACFLLKVDENVVVEQYHYGKAQREGHSEMNVAILGKEMPVFEFKKGSDDLYETSDEVRQRQPFLLLQDHFLFAFENAKDVLSKEVLARYFTISA
jgi:hypothetical protein